VRRTGQIMSFVQSGTEASLTTFADTTPSKSLSLPCPSTEASISRTDPLSLQEAFRTDYCGAVRFNKEHMALVTDMLWISEHSFNSRRFLILSKRLRSMDGLAEITAN
jgi:hypothetical protein